MKNKFLCAFSRTEYNWHWMRTLSLELHYIFCFKLYVTVIEYILKSCYAKLYSFWDNGHQHHGFDLDTLFRSAKKLLIKLKRVRKKIHLTQKSVWYYRTSAQHTFLMVLPSHSMFREMWQDQSFLLEYTGDIVTGTFSADVWPFPHTGPT